MPHPHKLLVCTDLSQPSLAALTRALALCDAAQGQCTVLHIIPEHWLSDLQKLLSLDPGQFNQQAIERQTQDLNQQVSALLHARPLNVLTRVRLGNPAQQIAQQIAQDHTDLLVLGSHGKGYVGHLLLGSTAMAVLHVCTCPVLVVRKSERLPYRKVLIAFEHATAHHAAAHTALVTAAQNLTTNASFVFAHVLKTDLDVPYAPDASERLYSQEAMIVEAYSRLGMLAVRSGMLPGQFQIEIITGSSAQALLDHAQRHQYDLMVIAKHSPHDMHDGLMSNFAQTILTQSHCDVLVATPQVQAATSPTPEMQ